MKEWSRLAEIQKAKTTCPRGHEYTPANTVVYQGSRKCRECKRARERRRYARQKEKSDVSVCPTDD